MNRPACRLVVVTLVLACVLSGCQKTPTPPSAEAQAATEAQMLAEIRKYQEETGKSLATLAEEVKRRQSLDVERAGEPPALRDLAVARYVARAAQTAAEAKDTKATANQLAWLKRSLGSLDADLPGRAIVRHVDRAIYHIFAQVQAGAKEFPEATQELLMASNAGVNGRPAVLVPDVLGDLETARAATAKGDSQAAMQALASVLGKAVPGSSTTEGALAAVKGAQEALGREAWPVVRAELEQVANRLAVFEGTVRPGVKAEEEAKAEAQPTQQPAAQPPAPAPAQPQATPAPQPTTPAPTQ